MSGNSDVITINAVTGLLDALARLSQKTKDDTLLDIHHIAADCINKVRQRCNESYFKRGSSWCRKQFPGTNLCLKIKVSTHESHGRTYTNMIVSLYSSTTESYQLDHNYLDKILLGE